MSIYVQAEVVAFFVCAVETEAELLFFCRRRRRLNER